MNPTVSLYLHFRASAIRFLVLTFCLALTCETKPVAAASLSVVASGLDNVRGLSFGPDGSLYITEAGVGGDRSWVLGPGEENNLTSVGTSAAVTRIKDGKQERILTGLPSVAISPTGARAAGPQDIQFDSAGNAYLLIGYAGLPASRDAALNSPRWGQLYKVDFNTGSLTSIADVASYELANNPDGGKVVDAQGEITSNAYTLAIKGDTAYIADAAANDVLSVGLSGSNLKTAAVLPGQKITNPIFPPAPEQELPPSAPPNQIPQEIEIQSVPTGVAFGPDGALYVSEFTGFPFPEGKARILRVAPDSETTVYADGFTQLSDLAFDDSGNLYALEYAIKPDWTGNLDGTLIQITPDGTRKTLVSGNELEAATALTVGPDGAIYVSSNGDRPDVGQVLRIDPQAQVPEPTSSALGVIAFGAFGVGLLLARQRKQMPSNCGVTNPLPETAD